MREAGCMGLDIVFSDIHGMKRLRNVGLVRMGIAVAVRCYAMFVLA